MTTYSSSKPPVVVPGYEPFNLEDAYVISDALPAHTEVMRSITVSPTDTSEWGLSWTGVMGAFDKGPQTSHKTRTDVPGVPVWGVALIVLGLALMAFGWLLNGPVSLLIYTAIHRS